MLAVGGKKYHFFSPGPKPSVLDLLFNSISSCTRILIFFLNIDFLVYGIVYRVTKYSLETLAADAFGLLLFFLFFYIHCHNRRSDKRRYVKELVNLSDV